VLDDHDLAFGHNRPEAVSDICEEPGEVMRHERHDGVTIEIIRPTRRRTSAAAHLLAEFGRDRAWP
jgi:hypothetical protein